MTTDVSFPVSSGGWICSGQDATIRRALLQAAWRRILPGACCVVVAAAECLPEVQALAAKSGTALRFFPAADQAYFPVFSPPDNQQRICRLVELMRLWGWDELLLGKVYAYLDLLLELDSWRQGRLARLDLSLVSRYHGMLAMERCLDQMPTLSQDQRRRFLEAYAECAAAGPALENFLRMLQPVCGLGQPAGGSAARLPAGAVAVFPVRTMLEEKHRQCLLRLLAFDLADVERLLAAGADKISVNSAAIRSPQLIEEIASRFGSQVCVLAIDALETPDGWMCYLNGGRIPTGKELFTWAKEGQERGAGEILFTSIGKSISATRSSKEKPMPHWLPAFFTSKKSRFPI